MKIGIHKKVKSYKSYKRQKNKLARDMENRCDTLADPENELEGNNGQNRVGNIFGTRPKHSTHHMLPI